MMKKIRVMIVDDSATVRQVLAAVLSESPDIDVIATAADPVFALEKMQREWPDVLVLDVEMPRMDGITFLRKLMSESPVPVVICSTLTEKGTKTSMQALAAGAVSVAAKPTSGLRQFLQESSAELVNQIRAAAKAQVKNISASAGSASPQSIAPPRKIHSAFAQKPADTNKFSANNTFTTTNKATATIPVSNSDDANKVVAIGASTGGTQALEFLLKSLPANAPGIVVVQHMPEKFTAAFAERLNTICAMEVLEASRGDRVQAGRVLIAPGGKHMTLQRADKHYIVDVSPGPPVNRHCPSVDVLYRSVVRAAGANALGIILTGMGDDGARGMKELHDAGATTLAQNEASCVVYGMPKEAVSLGGVSRSLSLQAIGTAIMGYAKN
jgi:two-component system chemotaxis response regulator CheB